MLEICKTTKITFHIEDVILKYLGSKQTPTPIMRWGWEYYPRSCFSVAQISAAVSKLLDTDTATTRRYHAGQIKRALDSLYGKGLVERQLVWNANCSWRQSFLCSIHALAATSCGASFGVCSSSFPLCSDAASVIPPL